MTVTSWGYLIASIVWAIIAIAAFGAGLCMVTDRLGRELLGKENWLFAGFEFFIGAVAIFASIAYFTSGVAL